MNSFPFDSHVTYDSEGNASYDRCYDSDALAEKFALLFKTGVFPNPSSGLQVTTSTQNMSVTVLPGNCNIEGRLAIEKINRTIVFEAADKTYDRIDRVVARLNRNDDYRNVDLYVVKGKPEATPQAPALTRTAGIYEICLANVFIARNTTVITASRITDTRLDKNLCGIVTSQANEVDTTTIFNQYQGALKEYMQFVQDCIDGTVEGQLRTAISELQKSVSNQNNTVGDLTKLSTSDKTSVVNAINVLAKLVATNKTSTDNLVNALTNQTKNDKTSMVNSINALSKKTATDTTALTNSISTISQKISNDKANLTSSIASVSDKLNGVISIIQNDALISINQHGSLTTSSLYTLTKYSKNFGSSSIVVDSKGNIITKESGHYMIDLCVHTDKNFTTTLPEISVHRYDNKGGGDTVIVESFNYLAYNVHSAHVHIIVPMCANGYLRINALGNVNYGHLSIRKIN